MKPYHGARILLLLACTLQASCAWLFPQRSGAFHDGYSAGCSAGRSKLGMQARDDNPRTHMQEEYRRGWSSGYVSCERSRISDDMNKQWQDDERKKRCERKHKKRDCN